MALDNMKAVVLETAILDAYKEASIVDTICQAPVNVQGKTARFNVLQAGAVKDYEGTVEADEIATAVIDLNYDKKKYFAIKVDDADKAMACADVMLPMAQNLAYQIKKAIERDILAEAVAKGAELEVAVKGDIVENIIDAGVKLDEANVPMENRFVIASPKAVAKIVKDERVMAHHGCRVLDNGLIEGAEVDGMRVIKCNNLPEGKMVVMHKDAVGFGVILENTESMRSEHSFADIIRGLAVYGAVALRPEAIVVVDEADN